MTTLSHRQRRKQFLEDCVLQKSVRGNLYTDTDSGIRITIFPDRHSPDRFQFNLILLGEDVEPRWSGKRYPSVRKALSAAFDAVCELEE